MLPLILSLCFALVSLALFPNCAKSDGQTQFAASSPPAEYTWSRVTERAPYPESYNFPVFVAKNKMWAFHPEAIWDSADGKTWNRSALPSMRRNVYQSQYVQFKDAVYALGDNSGNYERMTFSPSVRRTTDFRTWVNVGRNSNLPNRIFYSVLVFDGKMWMLGGYDGSQYHNDVWNSVDGATWTRVTAKAGWSPRTGSTVVVFRNKIYLIGGSVIDGTPDPNPSSDREIWSSSDGSAWTRIENDLQNRSGGFPIVFDDKLWLVGANRDGSFARSSLVSSDGATWNEVAAPWSPRGGAAAWIFNDKLYMTGGKYSVTENGQIRFIYSNDVWVMEKRKENK